MLLAGRRAVERLSVVSLCQMREHLSFDFGRLRMLTSLSAGDGTGRSGVLRPRQERKVAARPAVAPVEDLVSAGRAEGLQLL